MKGLYALVLFFPEILEIRKKLAFPFCFCTRSCTHYSMLKGKEGYNKLSIDSGIEWSGIQIGFVPAKEKLQKMIYNSKTDS